MRVINIVRTTVVAVLALFAMAAGQCATAGEAKVAVAANFTAAAKEIAAQFGADTGHRAVLIFGSTGKLYAQISNGAPFDVFLAADAARPERAEKEALAVAGSRFTYALGRIVLYSLDPALVDSAGAILRQPQEFARLAIANPATAPYGAAAVDALKALQLYDTLKGKLVMGENIGQTMQFVITGNAPLGFVALAQLAGREGGSRWLVPSDLYAPIRQQAVLLKRASGNAAAKAFLDYLKTDKVRAILVKFGYGVE